MNPTPPESAAKPLFKSRTIILNALLTAAVVFVPQVGAVVQTMPEIALAAVGLLNIGLRFITRKRVQLFPEPAANRPEYDDEDLFD